MVLYLKLNLLKKQTGQIICLAINAVKLVSRQRLPVANILFSNACGFS